MELSLDPVGFELRPFSLNSTILPSELTRFYQICRFWKKRKSQKKKEKKKERKKRERGREREREKESGTRK